MLPSAAQADEIQRDAADLRRSMRITLWSYVLRIATPVLLIIVIRLYGAGPYGVFAVVTAILTFLMRVTLLGLDKGLLWWLPRQPPGHPRAGLGAVLALTSITSSVAAVVVALALAPWLAAWAERPEAVTTLRWMAVSLLPMSLSEVFIHACAARRRPEAQIVIKDGLVPVLTAGLAVGFHFAGVGPAGLGLAHTLGVTVGLGALLWLFARAYVDTSWDRTTKWLPPPELLRAARPLWFADLLATALTRLDLYMLAALSDPVTAGLYQGALQIAQNALAVRGSFDSLVAVLVAEIQLRGDLTRLIHGFSHALGLVALVVVPLAAFIFAGAGWILPLLGAEFVQGESAVWILTAFFAVHGTLGMNQQILIGSGRGAWVPIDAAVAMAIGVAAFTVLVPQLGLTGAALANGMMYLALSLLYIVQARQILGVWPYDRGIVALFALSGAASLVMAALWFALQPALGPWARLAGLLGFVAVFTPGAFRLRRAAVTGAASVASPASVASAASVASVATSAPPVP